jgi:cytochrome c553
VPSLRSALLVRRQPPQAGALARSQRMRAQAFCIALLCFAIVPGPAGGSDTARGDAAGATAGFVVPDWLFPIGTPAPAVAAPDPSAEVRVPGSEARYTTAQVKDLFAAPDWHAGEHPPMPEVVARGRRPGLYACGYCHLPDGAGRPENATLAGLPAEYIVQQVRDIASGARSSAWTGPPYRPATLMQQAARLASDQETRAAADYFSSLRLERPRADVVEAERVPRTQAFSWVLVAADGGGEELLGTRLIEIPRDLESHEHRDSHARYVAYVPPGSLERGRQLAVTDTSSLPSCASCHGTDLRGVGPVPAIAGRSPSYLLRQLIAFRTGARDTPAGAPMRSLVAGLDLEEMIAVAAYAAAQPP